MKFRWIHFGLALVLSFGAAAAGCTAQTDSESEQQLGTLHLPLVTPMQGSFRLRNATFAIKSQSGTPVVTLDSESDPDAPALSASLTQGSYTARLQNGWALNSVAADGTESPVAAALITQNPQNFKIKATVDTALSFTFVTVNGTVTIGNGMVDITVDVSSKPTLTGCDVTSTFNCPFGQTCLVANSSGGTFCATPGSLAVGSPCTSDQCVAGSQCLKLDPNNPDQGTCTQFCNTGFPPFGCNCISLGFDNSNAGVCGAPPPGACDLLAQTGCDAGEACQLPSGASFGSCGVPGTTPAFGFCTGETCGAGFQCSFNTCRQFCDTRKPFPGDCPNFGSCFNVGTGFIGRCF